MFCPHRSAPEPSRASPCPGSALGSPTRVRVVRHVASCRALVVPSDEPPPPSPYKTQFSAPYFRRKKISENDLSFVLSGGARARRLERHHRGRLCSPSASARLLLLSILFRAHGEGSGLSNSASFRCVRASSAVLPISRCASFRCLLQCYVLGAWILCWRGMGFLRKIWCCLVLR